MMETATGLYRAVTATFHSVFAFIPASSALREPALIRALLFSIALHVTVYHAISLHPYFAGRAKEKVKRRCWILTTFNALVTTTLSAPFLVDLIASGFDLHAVQPRNWLSKPAAAFFIAYLLCDLSLGAIYYRKLINFASGWAHHTAYTFLFSYWLHRGWQPFALMACVFELPTLVMGLSSIWPALRSNNAFTISFFLTRVFFHFGLLCASVTPHGRAAPLINGSKGVAVSVACTYPMHVWWGYKCILSVRRRMQKRKLQRREVREAQMSQGSYFAGATAQLFSGLPPPDTSSAVNTPAASTPGSSGATTPTGAFGSAAAAITPAALHSAFARAAAAGRAPIEMVRRRRAARANSTDAVPTLGSHSLSRSSSTSSTSSATLVGSLVPPKMERSRSAGATEAKAARLFTAPIPPSGAAPDAQGPFLAIRSPAETQDRARRLVADAARKAWASAPSAWRARFEEELQREERIAARSAAASDKGARRRSVDIAVVTSTEDEAFHDATSWTIEQAAQELDEGAASEPEPEHDELTGLTTEQRSRTQRGRDAARRALVRAVRRAINGRGADGVPLADAQERMSAAKWLAKVDVTALLRTRLGQEFDVREFPIEQMETEGRGKRLLTAAQRRFEVARRDVVVWDDE